MEYSLEKIEPPKRPFVSLNRAKNQCNLERSETYDDEFVVDLVEEATEMVEDLGDITLLPTTYRLTMARFPRSHEDVIYLPRPPLVIVNSVKYYDANNVLTILDDSQNSTGDMSSVSIDLYKTWPKSRRRPDAVQVEYQSGSTRPPARARRAILLLVAQWYADREGERSVPETVLSLIEQLRPGDEFKSVA